MTHREKGMSKMKINRILLQQKRNLIGENKGSNVLANEIYDWLGDILGLEA